MGYCVKRNILSDLEIKSFIDGSKLIAKAPDGSFYLVSEPMIIGKDVEIEWVTPPPPTVNLNQKYNVSVKIKNESGSPIDVYFGLYCRTGNNNHEFVSSFHDTNSSQPVLQYGSNGNRLIRKKIEQLEEGQYLTITATMKPTKVSPTVKWVPWVSFRNQTYTEVNDPDGITKESKTTKYIA